MYYYYGKILLHLQKQAWSKYRHDFTWEPDHQFFIQGACGDSDYPGIFIRLDDKEVMNFISMTITPSSSSISKGKSKKLSLLSRICPFPAIHSLLVTIIC